MPSDSRHLNHLFTIVSPAISYREQYRGSELLREEQNRILEERVEMLKSHLDGSRKDSESKVRLLSKSTSKSTKSTKIVL